MKNKRKSKNIVLAMGILAIGVSIPMLTIACGSSSQNKNRIAFVKSTDNSSYDKLLSNVGSKYAKELDFDWDEFSSAGSSGTEGKTVDTIINSNKYKTVVFQPVNTTGSLNSLKKLLDAKIYVSIPDRVFSNTQISDLSDKQKKYLVMQITSDNEQIAKDAAKKILDYWLEKGIITNVNKLIDKKYILMEGESGSASSEDRKKGFQDFFKTTNSIDGIKTITSYGGATQIGEKVLTGEWSSITAQKAFNIEVNRGKDYAGIGMFAANDQMAHGVLTSSAMETTIGGDDYPIVTVDAHKIYKAEIVNDASTPGKKIIANFGQRTETTMKLTVYSLIYALQGTDFKGEKSIKWIEDDQNTSSDDDAETSLADVTKTFVASERTVKLPGIAVTRGTNGKLINENVMVD